MHEFPKYLNMCTGKIKPVFPIFLNPLAQAPSPHGGTPARPIFDFASLRIEESQGRSHHLEGNGELCGRGSNIGNCQIHIAWVFMHIFLVLIFLILNSWSYNSLAQQSLLISNVHIVDVEKGQLYESLMDVFISEGRIRQIAPTGEIRTGKGAQIFDAQKAYLIPGLWDMHTHPDDPEVWRMNPVSEDRDLLMPQFVLHGVTGIRDMAGSLEVINSWREKGKKGELLVPKIYAAGPLLDGPNPMWDGSIGISSPAHVKPVVDSLINAGVDFLKVYSLLPREIYFALAKYANEIDFPFVGHVPLEVTPSEAAKTGMKSEEHLLEILLECSDKREALVNRNSWIIVR